MFNWERIIFPGDFSNHFPYCFRFSGGINFNYILLPAFLFCFVYCFALFCLYSMQFWVVGSFFNFLKTAFLCWIAFFTFCVKPRFVFFLLWIVFLGIHASAIVIRVFVNFSIVWIFPFMSCIEQSWLNFSQFALFVFHLGVWLCVVM